MQDHRSTLPTFKVIGIILTALSGAWIGYKIVDTTHQQVGPVNTSWSVDLSVGNGTKVDVPVIDAGLKFPTHWAPLGLRISIDGVNTEIAEKAVGDLQTLKGLGRRVDLVTDQIGDQVQKGAQKALLFAVLGMLIGAFLLTLILWRKLRIALTGTGLIAAFLIASGLLSYATYDQDALSKTAYHGVVAKGVDLLGDVPLQLDRFNDHDEQLVRIVSSLAQLYQSTFELPTGNTQSVTRALLISDVHDWQPTYEIVRDIIANSNIDLVIDAGDLTKYGSASEGDLLMDDIASLDIPYVFVKGNHDSEITLSQLEELPNTVVLEGQAVDVAGLRILGSSDPRQPHFSGLDPVELVIQQGDELAAEAIEDGRVDLAVVHNPDAGRQLFGTVPLVLAGHIHQRLIEIEQDTMMYVEGSTSGGVLDFVATADDPQPRLATILEFDSSDRLVAYARIDLPPVFSGQSGDEQEATITRTILDEKVGSSQGSS